MPPQFEPVITADGSLSCLDSETGQLCHNKVGAYTEALYQYVIPSGLLEKATTSGNITVIDACYGLGYNTWVLINELLKQISGPCAVQVIAIEKNPEIIQFLPRLFELPMFDVLKSKIDPSEHNIYYRTLACFTDTKGCDRINQKITIDVADFGRLEIDLRLGDLRTEIQTISTPVDAIFHDPFSPQKMPELWTVDLFRRYHELLLEKSGLLLTYSAAAAVRGGLQEAGFQIGKTEGLGAKSGGTIAWVPSEASKVLGLPLTDDEVAYLETRSGIPYRDPSLSASREDILSTRENEQANSSKPSGAEARRLLHL